MNALPTGILPLGLLDDEDLEGKVADAGGAALLRKPVDVNHLADQIEVYAAA